MRQLRGFRSSLQVRRSHRETSSGRTEIRTYRIIKTSVMASGITWEEMQERGPYQGTVFAHLHNGEDWSYPMEFRTWQNVIQAEDIGAAFDDWARALPAHSCPIPESDNPLLDEVKTKAMNGGKAGTR